ncbi:hypothetical protein TNCV_1715541 [Trichonephila clavipes]|nr:hypothetical protein TNCV_1715541 [Trichonephila clavipes]
MSSKLCRGLVLQDGLGETRSFHVTRIDAGRRRAASSPSLEECILNFVSHKPESSTRDVVYHRVQALTLTIFSDYQWVEQQ